MTSMENKLGYKKTKLGWIPEEWMLERFGDVVKVRSGQVNPTEPNYNDLVLIAPNHIEKETGRLLFTETANQQHATSGKYYCEKGDVIYSKIRPYLKKVIVTNRECLCSADMYPLYSNFIDNRYLMMLLLSNRFTSYASSVSARTGIPKINRADLSAFKVVYPPLPEQQKIATILSAWDKAIDKLSDLIDAKEEQKKGLMQRMLTGKVRLTKHIKKKGYYKSKIGQVPSDWKVIKAENLFTNISIKNNIGESLLAVTQDKGVIARDELVGRVTMPSGSTDSYKLVEAGNFVISLRSFQGGLEYSKIRGIVSPAYTILRILGPVDPTYFVYYFKSNEFISRLAVAVVGIRDGKQISYKDFKVINFRLPPIDEQKQIGLILQQSDKEIEILNSKKDELELEKKGLMQQLLTGKTRVRIK